MNRLNPRILRTLVGKTQLAESTIRSQLSRLRTKYPSCTQNAVAQIYAQKKNLTVLGMLDADDRKSLQALQIEPIKERQTRNKQRPTVRIIDHISYETDDMFKKGHIKEFNRAFSKGCYTSANILARKIVENLIIDILRKRFPSNSKENTSLYYDIDRGRYKDFSRILENLNKKRTEFAIDDRKPVERLVSRANRLKGDANDKAHSWYFLVRTKKEIEDLDLPAIIGLVIKLERSVGLRD